MIDTENVDGMYEAMKYANQIRSVLEGIDIQSLNAQPKEEKETELKS
jgi:hypothetical protein